MDLVACDDVGRHYKCTMVVQTISGTYHGNHMTCIWDNNGHSLADRFDNHPNSPPNILQQNNIPRLLHNPKLTTRKAPEVILTVVC